MNIFQRFFGKKEAPRQDDPRNDLDVDKLPTRPKDAVTCYNQGADYFKLGNYDQAIKNFDKAIELNPNYSNAYCYRGVAYFKLGNHDQAIKDYDKTIELNPKDEVVYSHRGVAYFKLGNHDQAIKDYDKAIELNPKDEVAYNNRGMAYRSLSNHDHAIKDFDKAIELNPNFAEAYSNRESAYRSLGNHDRAIKDHAKAKAGDSLGPGVDRKVTENINAAPQRGQEVSGPLWVLNKANDLYACAVCGFEAWQAGTAKTTHCNDLDQCPKCGAYSRMASENKLKAEELMQAYEAWKRLPEKEQLVVFKCESCSHTIRVPLSKCGEKEACPQCGQLNLFPIEVMLQPDGSLYGMVWSREARKAYRWIAAYADIVE